MSNGDAYEKYLDGLQKLLSENYNQAKSYTNIIIFAGYASYFTIVNYCKEYVPTNLFLWSILLMSVSIICFVSFEVFSMINTSYNLRAYQDALSNIEKINEYNKAAQRQRIRMGRIWSYHLYPTLVFAIVSVILFLLPLFCKLFCKIL